jgi:hypothetical protein
VGDAAAVGGAQRVDDRDAQIEEPSEAQSALRDVRGEGNALDQLHGEETDSPVFLHRVDSDDVGVVQRSERLGLALEPYQVG